MKKGWKKMNNYYLTDEDIHGCEEDETETILRDKIRKKEERIEELEDAIKYILKIYDNQDVVYSFKNVSLIKETLKNVLGSINE
jgi:hypothetical protein